MLLSKFLPSRPVVLTLAIGAVGGFLADVIDLPLAWMLGALATTMIASIGGVRLCIPDGVRLVTLAVIGVFLGTGFTDGSLARIGDWATSLAALVVFVPVSTVVSTVYYRRIGRFDRVTALFSATPGGLTPMVVIGGASGGDMRRIALTQGLRVVFLVVLTPLLVLGVQPADDGPPVALPAVAAIDPVEVAVLVGTVLAGIAVARLLRVPAAEMTGAMFTTAALYATGTVALALPETLLNLALWLLGSALGARFAGFGVRELLSVTWVALGAIALMLVLALVVAALVSLLPDVAFLPALLAFAPGGVSEMCLIALAFDLDPAFVAFHHLVRLTLILLAAPLVARVLYGGSEPPARATPAPS